MDDAGCAEPISRCIPCCSWTPGEWPSICVTIKMRFLSNVFGLYHPFMKVLVVHGGHQDFSFFFPSWIYVTTPVMSPACVLIHQLKMLSFHCHVRWLEVRIVNRGFMGQSVGETMEWLELYQVPSLSLAPWIDVFVAVNVGHFVETQLPNPKRFWMIWISRWLDIFRRLCSCSLWVMILPQEMDTFFCRSQAGQARYVV